MRVKATGVIGEYEVFAGHNPVGVVSKKIERYNLRRPVTVTSWIAWYLGERIDGHFGTRRAAVAAIESAHTRRAKHG